jgi:hypothetical protein
MPYKTHRAPLRYNISDFFSSLLGVIVIKWIETRGLTYSLRGVISCCYGVFCSHFVPQLSIGVSPHD